MSAIERRAKAVFLAALDVEPAARASFVRDECAGDPGLLARVEDLLRADSEVDDAFLESPRVTTRGPARTPMLPVPVPADVGPYRLGERLGAGGMGEVYTAVDTRDGRRVAIKLLRPDVSSAEALRRFRQEASLLARFTHEGIAAVEAAGTTESAYGSRPWFALELVVGVELDRWAREARPDVAERVELLARVSDAVDHAHGHGVVHRDLKPSNVIVRGDGRPKVLDFGVARVIGDLSSLSMHTLAGDVLGTVAYMSPEQLAGGAHEVDARSDVYSLGVILYQLLAGVLPYDLTGKNLFEAARTVREVEPTRLSRRDPRLRGDLETIAAKALEKDPARRFASARELAADLRRHLAHEPIRARPPSVRDQVTKLARRHPAVAAASLALALGGAVALAQWVRARESSIRAEAREREAALEREAARAAAYRTHLAAAIRALDDGDGAGLRRALDAAPTERRGFEWRALDHLADASRHAIETLAGAAAPPRLSADGERLEALRAHDEVGVWRLSDGTLERAWRAGDRVLAFTVAPRGDACLVSGSSSTALLGADGVELWRTDSAAVLGAAFEPALRWVALVETRAAGDARIVVRALDDGRVLRELATRDPARKVDVCAAGELLLVTHASGAASVIGAEDGRTRWLTGPGVTRLARDGRRVVLQSATENVLRTCEVATGRIVVATEPVFRVGPWAVSEDGRRIVLVGTNGLEVRDARGERVLRSLLGAATDSITLEITRDGEHVITAERDGVVRVWEVSDDAARPYRGALDSGPRLGNWAIARDGSRIAYGTWGGAMLVDGRTGEPTWSRTISRGPTDAVALSPDESEVAAGIRAAGSCSSPPPTARSCASATSHRRACPVFRRSAGATTARSSSRPATERCS